MDQFPPSSPPEASASTARRKLQRHELDMARIHQKLLPASGRESNENGKGKPLELLPAFVPTDVPIKLLAKRHDDLPIKIHEDSGPSSPIVSMRSNVAQMEMFYPTPDPSSTVGDRSSSPTRQRDINSNKLSLSPLKDVRINRKLAKTTNNNNNTIASNGYLPTFAPSTAQDQSFTIRSPLSTVALVRLPTSGKKVTIGRSSQSCDVAVSRKNKLVSRVHASVHYDSSTKTLSIECLGWNGLTVVVPFYESKINEDTLHDGYPTSTGTSDYEVAKGHGVEVEYVPGITIDIRGERALLEVVDDDVNDETEDEILPSSQVQTNRSTPQPDSSPDRMRVRETQKRDQEDELEDVPMENVNEEPISTSCEEINQTKIESDEIGSLNGEIEIESREVETEQHRQQDLSPVELQVTSISEPTPPAIPRDSQPSTPDCPNTPLHDSGFLVDAAQLATPIPTSEDGREVMTSFPRSSPRLAPSTPMFTMASSPIREHREMVNEQLHQLESLPEEEEKKPALASVEQEDEHVGHSVEEYHVDLLEIPRPTQLKMSQPEQVHAANESSQIPPPPTKSDSASLSIKKEELEKSRPKKRAASEEPSKKSKKVKEEDKTDNVQLDKEEIEKIVHLVANNLAFSRLSSTPLSTLRKTLGVLSNVPKRILQGILSDIKCVGIIQRSGKDAAGKPLEEEYYYLPENDDDEHRRLMLEQSRGHGGLRSCRRQHKQVSVIESGNMATFY